MFTDRLIIPYVICYVFYFFGDLVAYYWTINKAIFIALILKIFKKSVTWIVYKYSRVQHIKNIL